VKETNTESFQCLLNILRDFTIFLVVNMVKGEKDFQAGLIIEKVCASFLSLKTRVLGRLSFDPAVEGAVNQMMPFPLRQEKSQAAKDLEKIAHLLLENCHLPEDSGADAGTLSEAAGGGSWSRFWRRAPA
jgi:MinD-like ATPase involved in chromosome partitioning or flagellar assembly